MTKKKKEKFNIFNEYKKSLDYIKESKEFIFAIVIIFFTFFLIGFFVPVPESIYNQILDFLKELLERTKGMSHFELTRFIFFNNLQSSFYGLIFGFFMGIFSIIATISNGYILGFVSSLSVKSQGVFSLWRLFPHGIFELPAIFTSLGLGVKLGSFIFQKKKLESFRKYLLNSLRVFLLIIIPLLVIAAIIEGLLIFFN